MLIRPHDAPLDPDREWRDLLASHPYGHLIAPGLRRELPVVVPTHVHFDGDRTIRLHLAKPNPVWPLLAEQPRCLFVVTAPYTYVPTSWEAPPGTAPEWGIPTSHYATVQLTCTASITDDPDHIRRYLADQLAIMQPDEPYGDPLDPDMPHTTELRQIRGLELRIDDVRAKFSSMVQNPTRSAARSPRATRGDTAPTTRSPRSPDPPPPTDRSLTARVNHIGEHRLRCRRRVAKYSLRRSGDASSASCRKPS